MPSASHLRTKSLAVLALLVLSPALGARNGRDFGGFYSLSHIQFHGSQVQATLALRLYNYSGADLRGAAVSVRETPPGARTLASYPAIAIWQDGTDIVVYRQVTIPRQEFERWTGQGQPNVCITYQDADGRTRQFTAQVSAHPIELPEDGGTAQ